jgi:glycosyltransferase involved in cell wall biosynthesis
MLPNLCIIIPAYNASRTIGDVVRGAAIHVRKVIVADDGSTDDTGLVASTAGAEVIRIASNKGKGHALKVLFRTAMSQGYDAAISMDADGQHDPGDLAQFLAAHRDSPASILVGTRMRDTQRIPRARYNSMHVARFYISLVANQFVEDTQCGYRLYPLSIIPQLNLMTERYVTETELLMKAGDMGHPIAFVTIRTIYGENGSHFRPITDVALITAYVISYIQVKWLIESVTSNHPNTYSSHADPRDVIARHGIADLLFQGLSVAIVVPANVVFLAAYALLPPLVPANFASVRKLGHGFAPITRATLTLPLLLIAAGVEKVADLLGIELTMLDRLIKTCYPDLWRVEEIRAVTGREP